MSAASEAAVLAAGDVIERAALDSVPVGRSIVAIGEDGSQLWFRSACGWSRSTTGQRGVASADLPALSWRLVHG